MKHSGALSSRSDEFSTFVRIRIVRQDDEEEKNLPGSSKVEEEENSKNEIFEPVVCRRNLMVRSKTYGLLLLRV